MVAQHVVDCAASWRVRKARLMAMAAKCIELIGARILRHARGVRTNYSLFGSLSSRRVVLSVTLGGCMISAVCGLCRHCDAGLTDGGGSAGARFAGGMDGTLYVGAIGN